MTEEEAKTKWCPFVRYVIDAAGFAAGNRYEAGSFAHAHCLCIGSACMAWRVEHPEVRVEASRGAEQAMNEEAMKTKRHVRREHNKPIAGYDTLVLDGTGYCGLAGKP